MNFKIILILAGVWLVVTYSPDFGRHQNKILQDLNAKPGKQILVTKGIKGDVLDAYWIYLPRGHDRTKKWPLLLFLAGGGSVGSELTPQNDWGPAYYIFNESDDPLVKTYVMDSFILITPHMKAGEFQERQWFDQHAELMDIISQVQVQYNSDPRRLYITGASRGGHGTWGLAERLVGKVAAMVPIAGFGLGVTNFSSLTDIPTWVILATGDPIVKYDSALKPLIELESLGLTFLKRDDSDLSEKDFTRTHILTSIKSDEHNVWDDFYAKSGFYRWLLQFISP